MAATPPPFTASSSSTSPPFVSSPSAAYSSTTASHPLSKHIVDNMLSCTTIDSTGHVIGISENIPKTKFLSENKLYARDLRSIDHTPVSIVPAILVRDKCILINLLHIKAMITHDRVLVFSTQDGHANSAKLGLFMYDLESKLQSNSCIHHVYDSSGSAGADHKEGTVTQYKQSFEMKALESILINVVSTLETEMKQHISTVNDILASLEDHIDREQLKELLIRNKALIKFHQKSLLIKNVINELLDNDEDLIGMYLTEKFATPEIVKNRALDDHEDVELLLESYYKQCDEMVQQAGQVIANVKNTEEIINIILDANRNSLMLMELKVTITTLGFTTGAFFASLYGMNLENFIEETSYGFGAVSTAIIAFSVGVSIFNFTHLRHIRKVTMMGTGVIQNQGSSSASAKAAAASAMTSAKRNIGQSAASSAYAGPGFKQNFDKTDQFWATLYRIWKGHAAERKWYRRRMEESKHGSHDMSRQRAIVWHWLVDSKANHAPPRR